MPQPLSTVICRPYSAPRGQIQTHIVCLLWEQSRRECPPHFTGLVQADAAPITPTAAPSKAHRSLTLPAELPSLCCQLSSALDNRRSPGSLGSLKLLLAGEQHWDGETAHRGKPSRDGSTTDDWTATKIILKKKKSCRSENWDKYTRGSVFSIYPPNIVRKH